MGDAGSLLVRAGLIDTAALEVARRARTGGGTLAEHLVATGAIDDEDLTQFFRQRLLVPRISDSKLASLPDKVIALLSSDMAAEHRAIPISLDRDGNLTVALSDPSDTRAVDEIGFFTERYVVRAVASQRQIAWGLANYYGVMTPLAEAMLADEQAAASDPDTTEPYLDSKKANEKRTRSLSIENAASRHSVDRSNEATFDDLASALEHARVDKEPARVTALRDSDHPPLEDDAPPRLESLPEHLRSAIAGPPPDEASLSGVIDAVDVEISGPVAAAPTVEIAGEAIELDAEYADDDEQEPGEAPLEDGSPPELAPRAGELLVGRRLREPSVGLSTPAVVLDDSLTDPAAPSPVAADDIPTEPNPIPAPGSPGDNAKTIEIDAPSFDDDEYYDYYEEDEPAAASEASDDSAPDDSETAAEDLERADDASAVPRRRERGTDSAPFLLSELSKPTAKPAAEPAAKPAAEPAAKPAAEPAAKPAAELVTLPADEPSDDVVLLVPKQRRKRETQVGLGVPEPRAAAGPTTPAPPPVLEPVGPSAEDAATLLLDGLESLQQAIDRDEVLEAALDYFGHFCDSAAFFAVRDGALSPWQVIGGRDLPSGSMSLSLATTSTLRDVVETRRSHQGPLADPASRRFISAVLGAVGATSVAHPVLIRGRVVGLVYAEDVATSLSSDSLALVVRATGRALERVLRRKPTNGT